MESAYSLYRLVMHKSESRSIQGMKAPSMPQHLYPLIGFRFQLIIVAHVPTQCGYVHSISVHQRQPSVRRRTRTLAHRRLESSHGTEDLNRRANQLQD